MEHRNVGEDLTLMIRRRINQSYALITARFVCRRELVKERVATIGNEGLVEILPEGGILQVRVHSGKWAAHTEVLDHHLHCSR
jgi:hypothetical protein